MFESAIIQPGGRGALTFSTSFILQTAAVLGIAAAGLFIPIAEPVLPEIHIPPPTPRFKNVVQIVAAQVSRSLPSLTPRPFIYRPPTSQPTSSAPVREAFEALPQFGSPAGVIGSLPVSAPPLVQIAPPPKSAVVEITKPPSKPTAIGGDVLASKIIRRVQPVYPQMARQTRTQGVVQLHGIINKEGRIAELRVLSGHPLLVNAALEAVRQWTYTPTLLNGQPVEVQAPIEVRFTLSQ